MVYLKKKKKSLNINRVGTLVWPERSFANFLVQFLSI